MTMQMTPEQTQEILQWRDRKLSAKEIARQMSLRPAEVNAFLREHYEQNPIAKTLPPIVGCFINRSATMQLLSNDAALIKKAQNERSGLCQVLVVRCENHQYIVTSYLIDYWCLGVKDALLKKCDRQKYLMLLEHSKNLFQEDLEEISLEQAQSIVFGAVDYAANLGFQPHADFERAKENLGPRLEALLPVTFGLDGQPSYISGPHDNPDKIIRTLKANVGDGNFDFTVGLNGY
jgi:hypothetical protein